MPEPSIDLRRLEQFVAAMEEPSLSAAAIRLHLSQQALSAALRQLEREVSATLFTRAGRRLTPTPAARSLYEGAPALLAGARQLAARTSRVETSPPAPFVVGRSPAVTADEAFAALRPLVQLHGNVSITVREVFPSEMTPKLQDGSIDLALRRGAAPHSSGLEETTLAYHELKVAMHHDHPLASAEVITLADLSATPIVVGARPHASHYTDFLVSQCRRAGFEPSLVVNQVQGTPPATAVLAHPHAVAFVTDETGVKYYGEVVVREIADVSRVPLQGLWLAHTVNPLRTALLDAAQQSRGFKGSTLPRARRAPLI